MKCIVLENTWLPPSMNKGWGNGYVLIPEGHPDHGKQYYDINVDVHGGLTFSELCDEKLLEAWLIGDSVTAEDFGCWIVGFDTCHFGDTPSKWTREAVERETERLRDQLLSRGRNAQASVATDDDSSTKSD